MNRRLTVLLGIALVMIITVSATSAQSGPRDRMRERRENRMHENGFEGLRGNMNISGEVTVDNAITITLQVQPTDDMIERINNHPRGENLTIGDLSNTITVNIIALVEYSDVEDNGFTDKDTIISQLNLDDQLLNDPVMSEGDNGTEYILTSMDDSFTMYLYLNEEDGTPRSWKWSIEVSYNFVETGSDLAIIQQVISDKEPLRHDRRARMEEGMTHREEFPENSRINESRFRDEHPNAPLFFKWDRTVLVDGETMDVVATRILYENLPSIAISFPQGDEIFYDPEIGVELQTLNSVENIIETINLGSIADLVNSPTVLGLALATILLFSVVIVAKYRN